MKKLLFTLIALLPFVLAAQTGKSTRPLYDKKTIGEIRLTLPVPNWSDALDSMRIYGMGLMNATVVIDGARYEGAGVRFRGDKSYQVGLKRNPLSIKLNHTDPSQNHQSATHLKLSSALRDPSMVREVLFFETAGHYIPAPQACFTKVFINEEYIGVYIDVENVDAAFLETHYGSAKNAFFKAGVDYKPETPAVCRQNIYGSLEYEDNVECYKGNFEMHSASGWNELQDLTRILNGGDLSKIEQVLDIDRTLWMHALNNVMVNLSSYSGSQSVNYFLYKDNTGRFQPILWDLNLSFGSFKNTGDGSDLELRGLQELDPLLHQKNPYKPLISQLLKDDFWRKVYLAHLKQINTEHFLNGAYEKRAQELQGMIAVPFIDDKYKLYSLDDFQSSLRETVGKRSRIPGIVELMSRRARFLKGHHDLSALPSAASNINVQGRGKFENQKLDAFKVNARADRFPKRMILYYRLDEKAAFTALPMQDVIQNDLPSGVKAFSVLVDAKDPNAVLEYYLLIENAGAVSFMPGNYMQQPFKVKLSDLNK